MTNVQIEGVTISPDTHEILKEMQSFPESFLSPIEDVIEYLMNDPEDNSSDDTLGRLRDLHFLKKQLTKLIPKGGDQ
jgi:hypothetical protein